MAPNGYANIVWLLAMADVLLKASVFYSCSGAGKMCCFQPPQGFERVALFTLKIQKGKWNKEKPCLLQGWQTGCQGTWIMKGTTPQPEVFSSVRMPRTRRGLGTLWHLPWVGVLPQKWNWELGNMRDALIKVTKSTAKGVTLSNKGHRFIWIFNRVS